MWECFHLIFEALYLARQRVDDVSCKKASYTDNEIKELLIIHDDPEMPRHCNLVGESQRS